MKCYLYLVCSPTKKKQHTTVDQMFRVCEMFHMLYHKDVRDEPRVARINPEKWAQSSDSSQHFSGGQFQMDSILWSNLETNKRKWILYQKYSIAIIIIIIITKYYQFVN